MGSSTQTEQVIDRLAELEMLRGVPRDELEWFMAHGELRSYETGGIVASKSVPIEEMVALLTGSVAVHFGHGTGRIHKMEAHAGELSGLLPFSRLGMPMGDAVATAPTELVAVHRDHFPALIRECPTITTKLVHAMVDRTRVAAATNWQDEKMMSLGRLAAGFAHQLNNPASAAARSAKQMDRALTVVGESAHALGQANLSALQQACVATMLRHCEVVAPTGRLAPMDRSDREEQLAAWLEARRLDTASSVPLADCDVTVSMLEELATALPGHALDPALRWIAASHSAQMLAAEVQLASSRIHDLIAGLKRFTSMDRAGVAQPMDLGQGLADTVSVLTGKASAKSVAVRLDIAPDLPHVTAHASDLNQVWSNLLENAIDAAPHQGEVTVHACREADGVVVRVIDNGPGIPSDVQAKMFDPFFTTKGVGDGIGLGLDIVRRIVRMHDGEVAVDTRRGRTEFRVSLPMTAPKSTH